MTSCKDIVDVCTLYIVHSNCQQCEYYRNCWEPYDHHMMIHTGEATLLCNIELFFFGEQSDLTNIVDVMRLKLSPLLLLYIYSMISQIEKFFEIWIEFFCCNKWKRNAIKYKHFFNLLFMTSPECHVTIL